MAGATNPKCNGRVHDVESVGTGKGGGTVWKKV